RCGGGRRLRGERPSLDDHVADRIAGRRVDGSSRARVLHDRTGGLNGGRDLLERLPPNRARRTGCRSMNEAMVSATRPRPWVWALLFIVAMGGASLASIYKMLAELWRSIVNLAALSLAVPMALSCRRQM